MWILLIGRVFMSRIESAKNYQKTTNYSPKQTNFASKQSFQSGTTLSIENIRNISHEIVKPVEKEISQKMPIINWISRKLADKNGEFQNQVINAIFTTTLAPAFIAWNPLSKQDEKTKQYTALRQPISAAIAILGGLPITMMINSYMNKISSEGHHKSIDLRMQPDNAYLKGRYKIEKGMISGQKVSFADYVEQIQKQKVDLFTSLISEHPNNIKIDENTRIISVLKKDVKGNTWTQMGHDIPNLGTQTELNKYLKSNNLHNVKFSDFMRDEFKFEFFNDGTIKPYTIEDKLKNVKAMDFLRKLGVVTKKDFHESDLNELLSIVRQRTTAEEEIREAIKSEAFKPNGIKKFIDAFSRQAARITQGYLGEQASRHETITLGQFFARFDYNEANLQKLMDGSMINALNEMKRQFNKAGKSKFNTATTIQDFAKNIMHNKIAKTVSYFKNYKTFVGIFANLFTTAVTCTALNWVYPRIIERFFPNLVKDDKPGNEPKLQSPTVQKGGNK